MPRRGCLLRLALPALLLVACSGGPEQGQSSPGQAGSAGRKAPATAHVPVEIDAGALEALPGDAREPAPAPETTTTVPQVTTTTRAVPPVPPAPVIRIPPLPPPTGRTWLVAGDGGGGDGSEANPFSEPGDALQAAQPGDVVLLRPGTYHGRLATVRAGRPEAPIRIVGDGARIVGDGDGHLVEVVHDYVTLERLDLSRADQLVWVQGATGVRILDNVLHSADHECVRIKFFASANEVAGNQINDCGRKGFKLSAGKKNGEGVYIGTAPEQLSRNPRRDPDASDRNWVHDNTVETRSECVDVKEAATGNVIERNTCRGSQDPDGAGLSSRGRGTIFSDNTSTGHAGSGIRLGGDDSTDGTETVVRGNRLTGNRGYGIKIMRSPQGPICGNDVAGNGDGGTNDRLNPATPC